MKLIHLSDLHLGKRIRNFSMLEDQRFILDRIIEIVDGEQPDAVLIAGDVYDKPVPPAEAVELFDDFLVRLAQRRLHVFVISGNHDSPERIAFGARLMDASGIHLSPVYNGTVTPVSLRDEFGTVNFYMLPFLKPVHVRQFCPDEQITSYTDALRAAIARMERPPDTRNVLITHQFVTGAVLSDSEELFVGGSDNVDAAVFEGFDYVALGHLHRPQNAGSECIRYCGTPLKYSFSEASHQKSVTVVELGPPHTLTVRTVPLKPMREVVELRGTYAQLTDRGSYVDTTLQEDYVHIILTDEEDILDAMGRLRTIYHHLMKLDYDNQRTRHSAQFEVSENTDRPPFEIFADFFERTNGRPLSDGQIAFLTPLIREIWEETP